MKRFRVELAGRAERQLEEIETFIATEANVATASDYVRALLDRCQSLCEFPMRGSPRDDIRHGLRSIPFRRRTTIFYAIQGAVVTIVGVAYGGRDQRAAVGKLN